MNPNPSAVVWFQLLALLAVEAALVALVLAIVQRHSHSGAWRRTFCQAGIAGVLLLAVCELSGVGRGIGAWVADLTNGAKIQARQGGELNKSTGSEVLNGVEHQSPGMGEVPRTDVEVGRLPKAQTLSYAGRRGRTFAATTPAASGSDSALVPVILLVWGAGIAVVAARTCVAQCLFIVFRSRRRAVTDEALLFRMGELAKALSFSRRVRLVESGRLSSPIAFGILRPTIGLPKDFLTRFDPEKRDVMLAHELAHLASHDPFWCLLADAATAVFWWHPGVWWMRRQLRLASELAADEASLLVVDGPRVLAECLIELGGQLAGPRLRAPLGISGFRSNLGCRVQRLIRLEGRNWSPPARIVSVLVKGLGAPALVAAGLLCTAWIAPNELTKGNGMNTIRQNWKKSLASLALLGALNAPAAAPGNEASTAASKAPDPTAPTASADQRRKVRIFPLRYATAADVQDKVRSKLSESDSVSADDRSNAIIVAAAEDEFQKVADLVAQLDTAERATGRSPEDEFRRRYGLVTPEGAAPPPA